MKHELNNLRLERREIREDLKYTRQDIKIIKQDLRENKINTLKLRTKLILIKLLDFF